MQGPLCIIRETWEDKAKPLEGVASYTVQMRSSGKNERTSPEKSRETWEGKGKAIHEQNKTKVLHKAKKYHRVTLLSVSGNLTPVIIC